MRNRFCLYDELARWNVRTLDAAAHMCEQLRHRDDVANPWDVLQVYGFAGQEGGGHRRERCVFCAANLNAAFESTSAFDLEAVHVIFLGSSCVHDPLWPPQSRGARYRHYLPRRAWHRARSLPISA